ncbi:MAG: tripartite tricarboxylate transporter permease [Streptosporangiales bacterium]|nr:tripartite tricarboxylate transporter permease [Streptosporangiales bacterium]
MEVLGLFGNGLLTALQPQNLLFAFIGCVLGQLIGVLPGIGSAAAIALLIPVTFNLPPVPAIIMLAGIFYGTNYGGTITSVLMNMPGESASVVTCIDGYQMARQGRAGRALGIAAIGSFIGGTAATIGLVVAAKPLTSAALLVGAPEYFALMVLGLALVVGLAGGSLVKALIMGILGLLVGTVGIDPAMGVPRFTFGRPELLDGLSFIPVVIGLFGVGEILLNLEKKAQQVFRTQVGSVLPDRDDLRRSGGAIARGTGIGFLLGLIPGATSVIASYMSYGVEVRRASDRSRFGRGAIEGVAGPETANNSFVNANFIPLFALGIPGTASVAMIMGGMMANGIIPGPLLFRDHADFVWTVIASMVIGNAILLILNLPLIRVWTQMLRVPYGILFAVILEFTIIGAYAVSNSTFDLTVMTVAGLLGYLLRKLDFPLAPLVLTLVIGPLMESNLRKALEASAGSLSTFVDRPIALTVLCVAGAVVLWSVIRGALARFRRDESPVTPDETGTTEVPRSTP